ncbi:MAG: inorganic phosphate transporter [Alistipes sp.]|nr:inorganic phosphate transporter [Alistipes sp.]
MSPIFTFIVITLGLLAVLGIVVGVTNDAVNFLNSALGSKAAPKNIILAIASAGIMVGVMTSSGMMEVARSGVFYPAQFTFAEIMMLFLGMMLGNIILLDIFNSLGLPTSTTVSLVFGLLGSAMAVAIYKIATSDAYSITDMSHFINSGKAMVIISAILMSVVIAFVVGLFVMWISRVIFSFRYNKMFNRIGALWCGISFTGIIYFAVFKGLKGLLPAEFMEFVNAHLGLALLCVWVASSALLQFLKLFKVNILKTTILMGTFSLALAFAGNDLVNFIGVPLAGYDSYKLALASGNEQMTMEALMNPARANFWIMCAAGLIMVVTLFLSRKAMNVSQTELSLSNQNEGQEKFDSTFISRGLVRGAIQTSHFFGRIVPKKLQAKIEKRFEPLPREEQTNAAYDLIRATVNLTCASILIAVATSFKLPLSTTYVVFMVAMGSSLADRAWGRESAVYRITGVMTVISGWFITAIAGFVISLIITLILVWGGWIAAVVLVVLCAYLVIKGNFTNKKKEGKETKNPEKFVAGDSADVMINRIEEVCKTMDQVTRIYSRTILAVFKENRKVLRDMVKESEELFLEARERKYQILPSLRDIQERDINTSQFYVQVIDYMSEATKALIHITRPAFDHIDNNHQGFNKEQIVDLKEVNDEVEAIFVTISQMLRRKHFSDIAIIIEMRDHLFDTIDLVMRNQLRRMKEGEFSTSASMLYFNILNETKTMVLQSRNIMRSLEHFVHESDNYVAFRQAVNAKAGLLEDVSE